MIGAFLFLPETIGLFPNATTLSDSLKKDFGNVQESTLDKVGEIDQTIDGSINTMTSTVDEIKQTSKDLVSNTASTANSTINKVFPFD